MLAEPTHPPSKANLKAWWANFTSAQKHKEHDDKGRFHAVNWGALQLATDEPVHTVFGKPLKESLKYASVQISTANANGELYVWGYIPVVVAKWCVCKYLE